jgi:hypothetical protein
MFSMTPRSSIAASHHAAKTIELVCRRVWALAGQCVAIPTAEQAELVDAT